MPGRRLAVCSLPFALLVVTVLGAQFPGSSARWANAAPAVTRAGDPVVVAAGDIACDPADTDYNGGNGTALRCQQRATSDSVIAQAPDAVLPLGDEQYEVGSLAAFQAAYDPTWGRFKNISHPAAGNHEYETTNASGYFAYFGASAGPTGKGWYSYSIGQWHVIVLNSDCEQTGVDCSAGSPQETWLKSDLAADTSPCTMAYWHHPRFTSSAANDNHPELAQFFQDLYAAHADLLLAGHDHQYERFAPQRPDATVDPAGLREIVVGTGGEDHHTFAATPQPNSEVRNDTAFGVLRLTLHPASYDFSFIPTAPATFTDSGTTACHGAQTTDAITAKRNSPSGVFLGAVVGPRQTYPGGGQGQDYENGSIYYSPATGAHEVHGAIVARYRAAGGPPSVYGFPTTDEYAATAGRASNFQNGTIVYNSGTGAVHEVHGLINVKYQSLGGPNGPFGEPTSDEYAVPGGRASDFHGQVTSTIFYRSGRAAAQEVHGAILASYMARGGPANATVGFPVGDELPASSASAETNRASSFEVSNLYFSASDGTVHQVQGLIRDHYVAIGEAASAVGLPVSDEFDAAGGRQSSFARGILLWTPQTGSHGTYGAIMAKYLALGGPNSFVGFPTSDEGDVSRVVNARLSTFVGASVYWSSATGAQEVHGAILNNYLGSSGPAGCFGLPVSDEFAVPDGRQSNFERGALHFRATDGQVTGGC
jgi:acid phosphatase type 7